PIPKELADRGYTPEVVAERMHSALASLGKDVKYSTVVDVGRKKKSGAANPIETVAIIGDSLVAEQVKLPNIVIPNIGLPIETLATSIRHFLHLKSRRNVSGEITSPQKKTLVAPADRRARPRPRPSSWHSRNARRSVRASGQRSSREGHRTRFKRCIVLQQSGRCSARSGQDRRRDR